MYMPQLQQLERCRAPFIAPHQVQEISSPLVVEKWAALLDTHPDKDFVTYILQGISKGFRIGYDYTRKSKGATSNLLSASQNPEVVTRYIQEEVALGRMLGPLEPELAARVHTSPFGVIPKGQTGKWRLIVDLSSPAGTSVNDGIDPSSCSLTYITVDMIAEQVAELGRGTNMGKVDIKSAYRIVPVNPEDRMLLGMQWRGRTFLDTRLPFGLRSAPILFTALADALEWIVKQQGVRFLYHYLDDYITLGGPGNTECQANLAKLLDCCSKLGVPIAQEKCEGPTTCLTFLGIEIDTEALELRLPADKLTRVQRTVSEWLGKKAARRRELESLLGLLQHAAKVVRPGRRFVRRLIQVMSAAKKRDHFVRLGCDVRSDLTWWHKFLDAWNGVGILPTMATPRLSLYTDASGKWGCAGIWGNKWFQWKWGDRAEQWHIAPKELLPIVLAGLLWGKEWSDMMIQCHCDNRAVVDVVNNGYSRDKEMMHLLRCLFFISEHHHFLVEAVHLPGKLNVAADALSRNNTAQFLQVVPEAQKQPTPVPEQALKLLVVEQPDWMSSSWTELFVACTRQA